MTKPNWREWRHTPDVRLWEACALSLNIDPHTVMFARDGWQAGPGQGPFLDKDTFRDAEQQAEFELRLRVLTANFDDREHFAPNVLNMASPGTCKVMLREFAKWAVYVVDWEIPPELREIGQAVCAQRPVATESDNLVAALAEVVNNGEPINWPYWQNVPRITPSEAASLLCGLDPDRHKGGNPTKNDLEGNYLERDRIARLIPLSHQDGRPLLQWAEWAVSCKIPVPAGMRAQSQAISTPETSPSPTKVNLGAGSTASPPEDAMWPVIRLAQEHATDPENVGSVWGVMVALANGDNPPSPLVGFVNRRGIRYTTDTGEAYFTMAALKGRMGRKRKKVAR